jgi:release factor glutamine methyltransferase
MSLDCEVTITNKAWNFQISIVYNEQHVLPPYPLSSQLIAKNISIAPGQQMLDLGTGCGLLAIVGKKQGAAYVLATDISQNALNYAKINFNRNGVSCDRLCSDLFESINNKKFDVIVANPTMFASKSTQPADVDGGLDGRKLLDKIIMESGQYLNTGGRLIVPTESYIGFSQTENLLSKRGFSFKKIARGFSPCGNHMMTNLNFDDIKGILHIKDNLHYFSSVIYEAVKR